MKTRLGHDSIRMLILASVQILLRLGPDPDRSPPIEYPCYRICKYTHTHTHTHTHRTSMTLTLHSYVQLIHLGTGGLQCKSISRTIDTSRMPQSSIVSVITKGLMTYVNY